MIEVLLYLAKCLLITFGIAVLLMFITIAASVIIRLLRKTGDDTSESE